MGTLLGDVVLSEQHCQWRGECHTHYQDPESRASTMDEGSHEGPKLVVWSSWQWGGTRECKVDMKRQMERSSTYKGSCYHNKCIFNNSFPSRMNLPSVVWLLSHVWKTSTSKGTFPRDSLALGNPRMFVVILVLSREEVRWRKLCTLFENWDQRGQNTDNLCGVALFCCNQEEGWSYSEGGGDLGSL